MCFRPTWSGSILPKKTYFWGRSMKIRRRLGSGLEPREMRMI